MKELKLPEGFVFKKRFGQNFITDGNLLRAIAEDAGVTQNTNVLEIGAGTGALTAVLGEKAKKVIAVEIDKTLMPFLKKKFDGTNVVVECADILNVRDGEIAGWFNNEPFSVVANLPYYISTPILFKFIEGEFNLNCITVMLQKELAARLSAKIGSKDYGSLTVMLDVRGHLEYRRTVVRSMFTPPPNVDSAIVKFTPDLNKYKIDDRLLLDKVVKSAFGMRRKTLVNNLERAFNLNKETGAEIIRSCGLDDNIRGEALNTNQFIILSKKLAPHVAN